MATGTKLMKEISDQFLVCHICQDPFKEPKTLSCLHTFCCTCIQHHYDSETNMPTRYTFYSRSVTCPVCRKKTDLPTGGVRRLPDNFLVSNLTDVLAKRCISKVPPCEICHTVRSRNSDACSKCLDCDKVLCRACVDLHTTTKVTQDHNLIDLEGQKDIECKSHPEETVRFYCEKCEECICVVCTFQEHKDHDVCSFNDGLARHKTMLESLVERSRERLGDVSKRLQVIDKYETASQQLKGRIRDMAISYTSQVRAREKELLRKVDEMFGGEMAQLAEKKASLQDSLDSLQGACDLAQMVMKDKGVEMLLLKREIEDKVDHLLEEPLPPEPRLDHMDVQFVPGQVSLGEVLVPGKDSTIDNKDRFESEKAKSEVSEDVDSVRPCRACLKRKRQEEREKRNRDRNQDGESDRKVTKSVYIQTRPQEVPSSNHDVHDIEHFVSSASQVNSISTVSVSNSSMQTSSTTVSSCQTNTDSSSRTQTDRPQRKTRRARGTMTSRQDVRTLKIQTEDSCLRDSYLSQAASLAGSYPNTGAAIAAAVFKQKTHDEDVLTKSWPVQNKTDLFSTVQTKDAEIGTDVSLGLTSDILELVSALSQGEKCVEVNGTDHKRPDLLAQTGGIGTVPPSHSSRSQKIQTTISAVTSACGKDRFMSDEELKKSLFSQSQSDRPSTSLNTSAHLSAPVPVKTCDASVMTSFKIKFVQDSVDKDTSTEPITSQDESVMTSLKTRTVYIQTQRQRMASTASGTESVSQMTKSTCTQAASCIDAETCMPQVSYDSRTTWTETTPTADRATFTESPDTADAVTLTMKAATSDAWVQLSPKAVVASTNTTPTKLAHHKTQTSPSLTSRGTMPDSSHLVPSPLSSPLSASKAASVSAPQASHALLCPGPSIVLGGRADGGAVAGRGGGGGAKHANKSTETAVPSRTTVAVGPSVQMTSRRTVSTDTLHLLLISDKETSTPAVKTVDDWTLTPKPQLINTGVTPPRPAVIEVGVATTPITLMDQATYTEVKTVRDSVTESYLVVCDSETLTERMAQCDAQTATCPSTETQATSMDDGCLKEETGKEAHDRESQCDVVACVHKEMNTTRHRNRARGAQTNYSYVECMLCQHPERLQQLAVSKTFTDTSTDPSPPDTQDVATMALSCLASPPGSMDLGVQTSDTLLYDKAVFTSGEFDEEFRSKSFLGLECQDAATSTESLPYIGLLSEIDVDELIVIPEANFELVSDSDDDCVSMVDNETWTGMLDYAEVGTQTLTQSLGSGSGQGPVLIRPEDDFSKDLVSIGVNTLPKVSFEKETCTPIRHLFSKGTMTFFVAKMDKATSTLTQARALDGRQPASSTIVRERAVKDSRHRIMDSKVTMTTSAEQRDMAVETDSSLVDDRITQCISKLRHVSERLNSPSPRKTQDGEVFFGQPLLAHRQRDASSMSSPASPKSLTSPAESPKDANETLASLHKDSCTDEEQRQAQLQSLLAETETVLRSKDMSPGRKPQPITTLKPRSAAIEKEEGEFSSKSFPRPRSLERQNKVKMGSQATSPTQLPLLRYHSAPGRIATVPAQTLLRKSGQTSPRVSPSRVAINQKQTLTSAHKQPAMPIQKQLAPSINATTPDSCSGSDVSSASSPQKVQQRPSLPSISETRTSSCSDSSFVSVESAESSLNPSSVMMSSHSRTSSNVTSVSDTTSDSLQNRRSADASLTDVCVSSGDDSSSVCSTSTTLMVTPTSDKKSSSGKKKKQKKGFMQRLLSGKKKKDSNGSEGEKEGPSKSENTPRQLSPIPQSPQTQQKQAVKQNTQDAKSKNMPKSGASRDSTVSTTSKAPSPSVSTHVSLSSDSAQSSTKGGACAAPVTTTGGAAAPPLPPHHYPPLPDPNKTPPPPPRPRPFVYVRQRVVSIQQDNVEEAKEKKEKEKEEKEREEKEREEKEKGKTKHAERIRVEGVTVHEQTKVKGFFKSQPKEDKVKSGTKALFGSKSGVKTEKEVMGKEITESKKGKEAKGDDKSGKVKSSKSDKSESKDKKATSKSRGWVYGK